VTRVLRISLFIFLSAVIGIATGVSSHLPCREGEQYVPGEVLVKFKQHTSASAAKSVHAKIGAKKFRRYSRIEVDHVKLPSGVDVKDALKEYLRDPSIEFAEPNYLRHLDRTPDDPFYGLLWGLKNTGQTVNGTAGTAGADISAPSAWEVATGSSAIVVAVIDSGADYNHPDLAGNIWINSGEVLNGVDDDGNGYIDDLRGWDFVDGDSDPMDPHGHGTHVSATIAARGNNSLGVAGVSWGAKIMALRGIDAYGYITSADFISALDYARVNGARIVNCSFGGAGYSQSEYNAIAAAREAGMLIVASAGNSAADNDISPRYPSGYNTDNIISVASTTQSDALSWFSSFGGTTVDLAAPGENIYSARPSRQAVWTDNYDDGSIAGWTTGGANNLWGVSNAVYYSSPCSLAVNPAGNYPANTSSWARSPALNLTGYKGCKLQFVIRGAAETNTDQLYVETSANGTTWTAREIEVASTLYSSYSRNTGGAWLSALVDFGALDNGAAAYFRFRFYSNGSVQNSGYAIDDVSVTASSSSFAGAESQYYQFMNGTSMAAPHVSGVAALAWSLDTGRNYLQVRNAVVNSVDIKPALSGKCSSGGRLNANSAIIYITDPQSWGASTSSGKGEGGGGGGGCFIATAAFGSPLQPQVLILKRFRDEVLMRSKGGRLLASAYYRVSPSIARAVADNGFLRFAVQAALLPLVASAWILLHPSVLFCIAGCAVVSAPVILLHRYRRRRISLS